METNFLEFKEEILKRAKAANSCVNEYKRAYSSESFSELMQVIKGNFDFACFKKVIDSELIKLYENQFNENKIYCNVTISEGFLLACDNATVEAWGNATVEACDNATVKACGNATVKACGNATVKAWGNAYATSYSTIECKLRENAIYRIRETNKIRYASDGIKFEKV